jgi:hypothetical protein
MVSRSRPSKRSIRAGASRNSSANSSRGNVGRNVGRTQPKNLVDTIISINAKTKRGLTRAEIKGAEDRALKEATRIANRGQTRAQLIQKAKDSNFRNNPLVFVRSARIIRDEEYKRTLDVELRKTITKATVQLRKKATEQEAKERADAVAARKKAREDKLSEQAVFKGLKPNKRSLRQPSNLEKGGEPSTLNRAESTGRNKISESPDDQKLFGEFTVGIEDEEVKRLEDVAQNSFDEYYEKQEGFVRAELAIKLKNLNEKFKIFSRESQFFLEKNIGEIDRDTAEDLLDMFNKAQASGTLDSGLLRSAANKIIEVREFDVEGEEMKAEFAREKDVLAKEVGIANAELTADKALDVQSREKEEAERTRFTENLKEEDNRRKMEQERSATELNEDFELDDPNAVTGNRAGPSARSQIKPREFTPPNLNFTPQQRAEISRSGQGSRGGAVPSRFAGQLTASTNVTGSGRQRSSSRSTIARTNTNTGKAAITNRSSRGSLSSRSTARGRSRSRR